MFRWQWQWWQLQVETWSRVTGYSCLHDSNYHHNSHPPGQVKDKTAKLSHTLYSPSFHLSTRLSLCHHPCLSLSVTVVTLLPQYRQDLYAKLSLELLDLYQELGVRLWPPGNRLQLSHLVGKDGVHSSHIASEHQEKTRGGRSEIFHGRCTQRKDSKSTCTEGATILL